MSHDPNDNQISPLMQELSSYMAGALRRKLPEEVAEQARIHLVDTFAAMISGTRLIPGKRAIAYVKTLGGNLDAGVVGTRIVTSALHAALANGICGHADETDDVHAPSRSHPGIANVPAVLAMAERQQASGTALLRAMVLSYDISTRVLLAMKQHLVSRTGHHPSSKGGLFGAAAGAGALLRLDSRKMRYLLSYCAEQAAGLLIMHRDSKHIEKAFVSGGMPAHNGVAAAHMVASGFTGVEDVLSGEGNFMSCYSPDVDGEAMVRGLGKEYEIMRTGIKYWAAGGPIQAPLHVLRDLMQQHGFKAGDVEKLVARMPDKELPIVDNRDMPDICVQHLLAVMLLDGNVTFATTHDFKRMTDPKVLELRRNRIQTVGDASLTDLKLRPWRCAMEITLKDGRVLAHQTMMAKGGMGNPLTRLEVEEKALDLLAPILGKKRSLELMSTLFNIEKIKDARVLRELYSA